MDAPSQSKPAGHHPVIIRVEDDEHVCYLLDFLLERHGFSVVKAKDGREFLEIFELDLVPDLIILDIMLPFIDGFELIKKIRNHPSWKDVPILVLSACESERDIVHGLEAGANDYVVKPFQPKELLSRIKRLLEMQNAIRKNS